LQDVAPAHLDRREVERVPVWDILIDGRPAGEQGEVHVFFSAKTHNVRELLTDCDAMFEVNAAHGWQLRIFRLLKPQTTQEWEWQI
jgi:hypothetical protein